MVAAERKLTYTNRVMDDVVFMLLDKGIGPGEDPNEPYIDGSRFAEELYYWKSQGKKCVVKINSPGGRVIHGWSMIDAIIETGAETENVGIAYSMGGICLMFGLKRRAYDYSSCMIHAPQGASDSYLKVVKAQFRNLLETRTKFTKDEIDEMMDSGKDYFFDAKQMLEKGIIDEIVTTDKKVVIPKAASTAELHRLFNSALSDNPNTHSKMENLFARIFKKSNDEEAAVAALEMRTENESLRAENNAYKAEIDRLKNELDALKAAAQANEARTRAEALINTAIKANKLPNLKEEDKEKLIQNAVANYDAVKIMLDGMPAQKTASAVSVVEGATKDKGDRTYEWLANNDPDRLKAIAESDPELFEKLQQDYIARMREQKAE